MGDSSPLPSPCEVTPTLLGPVLGFPCKKNVGILQSVPGVLKGAERAGVVLLEEEKAEWRMGGLFLFVFKYLEKDYREHKTLLRLLH